MKRKPPKTPLSPDASNIAKPVTKERGPYSRKMDKFTRAAGKCWDAIDSDKFTEEDRMNILKCLIWLNSKLREFDDKEATWKNKKTFWRMFLPGIFIQHFFYPDEVTQQYVDEMQKGYPE